MVRPGSTSRGSSISMRTRSAQNSHSGSSSTNVNSSSGAGSSGRRKRKPRSSSSSDEDFISTRVVNARRRKRRSTNAQTAAGSRQSNNTVQQNATQSTSATARRAVSTTQQTARSTQRDTARQTTSRSRRTRRRSATPHPVEDDYLRRRLERLVGRATLIHIISNVPGLTTRARYRTGSSSRIRRRNLMVQNLFDSSNNSSSSYSSDFENMRRRPRRRVYSSTDSDDSDDDLVNILGTDSDVDTEVVDIAVRHSPVRQYNTRSRNYAITHQNETSTELDWRPYSLRSFSSVAAPTTVASNTSSSVAIPSTSRGIGRRQDTYERPRYMERYRRVILDNTTELTNPRDVNSATSVPHHARRFFGRVVLTFHTPDVSVDRGPQNQVVEQISEPDTDPEERAAALNNIELDPAGYVSSDGETDKCPICLIKFVQQEVAVPSCCDHTFCANCISKWADSSTTCPVDRRTFKSITIKRRFGGKSLRRIHFQERFLPADNLEVEISGTCIICNMETDPTRMVYCQRCDRGFHIYCLNPPLEEVTDNWHCELCVNNQSSTSEDSSGAEDFDFQSFRRWRRLRYTTRRGRSETRRTINFVINRYPRRTRTTTRRGSPYPDASRSSNRDVVHYQMPMLKFNGEHIEKTSCIVNNTIVPPPVAFLSHLDELVVPLPITTTLSDNLSSTSTVHDIEENNIEEQGTGNELGLLTNLIQIRFSAYGQQSRKAVAARVLNSPIIVRRRFELEESLSEQPFSISYYNISDSNILVTEKKDTKVISTKYDNNDTLLNVTKKLTLGKLVLTDSKSNLKEIPLHPDEKSNSSGHVSANSLRGEGANGNNNYRTGGSNQQSHSVTSQLAASAFSSLNPRTRPGFSNILENSSEVMDFSPFRTTAPIKFRMNPPAKPGTRRPLSSSSATSSTTVPLPPPTNSSAGHASVITPLKRPPTPPSFLDIPNSPERDNSPALDDDVDIYGDIETTPILASLEPPPIPPALLNVLNSDYDRNDDADDVNDDDGSSRLVIAEINSTSRSEMYDPTEPNEDSDNEMDDHHKPNYMFSPTYEDLITYGPHLPIPEPPAPPDICEIISNSDSEDELVECPNISTYSSKMFSASNKSEKTDISQVENIPFPKDDSEDLSSIPIPPMSNNKNNKNNNNNNNNNSGISSDSNCSVSSIGSSSNRNNDKVDKVIPSTEKQMELPSANDSIIVSDESIDTSSKSDVNNSDHDASDKDSTKDGILQGNNEHVDAELKCQKLIKDIFSDSDDNFGELLNQKNDKNDESDDKKKIVADIVEKKEKAPENSSEENFHSIDSVLVEASDVSDDSDVNVCAPEKLSNENLLEESDEERNYSTAKSVDTEEKVIVLDITEKEQDDCDSSSVGQKSPSTSAKMNSGTTGEIMNSLFSGMNDLDPISDTEYNDVQDDEQKSGQQQQQLEGFKIDNEGGAVASKKKRKKEKKMNADGLEKDNKSSKHSKKSSSLLEGKQKSKVTMNIEQRKKRKRKNEAAAIADEETVASKEIEEDSLQWKKLMKSTKERNYRDGKRESSYDEVAYNKENTAAKKREKRKELPRYDVRKIVAERSPREALRSEYNRNGGRGDSSVVSWSRSRSRSRYSDRHHSNKHSRRRSRSYRSSRGTGRYSPRWSSNRSSRSRSYTPLPSSRTRTHRSRQRSRSVTPRSRPSGRLGHSSKEERRKKLMKSANNSHKEDRYMSHKQKSISPLEYHHHHHHERRKHLPKEDVVLSRSRSRSRSYRITDRPICLSPDSPTASLLNNRLSQQQQEHANYYYSNSGNSWSRHPVDLIRYSAGATTGRPFTPSPTRMSLERIPLVSPASAVARLSPDDPKNLTVIVPNTSSSSAAIVTKKKRSKKNKEKEKEKTIKEGKRNKKKKQQQILTTPTKSSATSSKEVFTSGDNILVSVSFNSKEAGNSAAPSSKRRRLAEVVHDRIEMPSTNAIVAAAERGVRKRKKIASNIPAEVLNAKPVAVIDLNASPCKEVSSSPLHVISLIDSGDELTDQRHSPATVSQTSEYPLSHDSDHNTEDTSAENSGPKTPPTEPPSKFGQHHQSQQQNSQTGLVDSTDEGEKGPRTPPPQQVTSAAVALSTSEPADVYDPFEPTKSRSASPEIIAVSLQDVDNSTINSGNKSNDNVANHVSNNNVNCENVDANKDVLIIDITSSAADSVVETKTQDLSDGTACTTGTGKDEGGITSSIPVGNANANALILDVLDVTKDDAVLIVTNSAVKSPDPKSDKNNVTTVVNNIISNISTAVNAVPVLQSLSPFKQLSLSSTTNKLTTNAAVKESQPLFPNIIPWKLPPSSVTTASANNVTLNNVVANASLLSSSSPAKPKPVPAYTQQHNDDDVADFDLDATSPYSPASSEGDDIFEPPPRSPATPPASTNKTSAVIDSLFESDTPSNKKRKEFPTKTDEDKLKVLDEVPNSAVELVVKEKFMQKLRRQERVVEEVKVVLKPHYARKHITKEEYKDILRKAVPKICHNKSGDINPRKIHGLIEAYVRKIRHRKLSQPVPFPIVPPAPPQSQLNPIPAVPLLPGLVIMNKQSPAPAKKTKMPRA